MSSDRHESLRPQELLFAPDERSLNVSRLWGITQADLHRWMVDANLRGDAPNDVRDAYDIARNLFLYSWYQYRFAMVAAQQAISTVEMALRAKFASEGISIKKNGGGTKTLRPLFEEAVTRGWISDAGFGRWLPVGTSADLAANTYCATLIEVLPKIRNWFAHGTSSFSDQGEMKDFIGRSGAIIDQLFPAR